MHDLTPTLSAVLISIYKPIVFGVLVTAWAWVAGWFDKDLVFYSLQRRLWNTVQLAVAALAFGLWILVPFWIGFVLALVLLVGIFAGYTYYRNGKVPEPARWTFSLADMRQRIQQAQTEHAIKRATVTLYGEKGDPVDVPPVNDPRVPAYTALLNLIDFTLLRGGNQIDLSADGQQCVVSVHVDGVKFPQDNIEGVVGVAMIDFLKECTGLDLSDRRRRQQSKLKVESEENGQHVLDLKFAGSTRGLTLNAFVDRGARQMLTLDQMGLLDSQLAKFRAVLEQDHRAIIVACPSGMGLTTMIYSLVNFHDPYTQSVVTLDEQKSFELEGVNHEIVDGGMAGSALSERLAMHIRADHQVMMVSRLMGSKVARQIAAASGDARFYVGIRQRDTFSALKAWLKAVGDLKRGGEALGAIISQRLVRNLCPVCRVAYKPDPEALRKMNLPPDRVAELYKQTGQVMVRDKPQPCVNCHTVGYRGRVGVFELMVLDEEAKGLIGQGKLDKLRAHLRRHKMLWLQEAALHKVVDGATSVSEVQRALAKDTKG